MADWTDMTNNLRRSGHFAGSSETERDAYFDFFAGSDGAAAGFVRATFSRALGQAIRLEKGRGLRLMPFELASPRGMDTD